MRSHKRIREQGAVSASGSANVSLVSGSGSCDVSREHAALNVVIHDVLRNKFLDIQSISTLAMTINTIKQPKSLLKILKILLDYDNLQILTDPQINYLLRASGVSRETLDLTSCRTKNLKGVTFGAFTSLKKIIFGSTNNLTPPQINALLHVSGAKLKSLSLTGLDLRQINFKICTSLKEISLNKAKNKNKIQELLESSSSALKVLHLMDCKLPAAGFYSGSSLEEICFKGMEGVSSAQLSSLFISSKGGLKKLSFNDCDLLGVDLKNLTSLQDISLFFCKNWRSSQITDLLAGSAATLKKLHFRASRGSTSLGSRIDFSGVDFSTCKGLEDISLVNLRVNGVSSNITNGQINSLISASGKTLKHFELTGQSGGINFNQIHSLESIRFDDAHNICSVQLSDLLRRSARILKVLHLNWHNMNTVCHLSDCTSVEEISLGRCAWSVQRNNEALSTLLKAVSNSLKKLTLARNDLTGVDMHPFKSLVEINIYSGCCLNSLFKNAGKTLIKLYLSNCDVSGVDFSVLESVEEVSANLSLRQMGQLISSRNFKKLQLEGPADAWRM